MHLADGYDSGRTRLRARKHFVALASIAAGSGVGCLGDDDVDALGFVLIYLFMGDVPVGNDPIQLFRRHDLDQRIVPEFLIVCEDDALLGRLNDRAF